MLKWFLIALGVVLLATLARLCVFTVDRGEFVYLTQFGRHIDTYDGADDDQAGLHFKLPWPIQTAIRVDRRLQYLDLPPAELVTADPNQPGTIDRTVSVDAYICWRVPDAQAAGVYIKRFKTTAEAREALRDRVRGALGAEIARMKLDDLISDQPGRVDREWEDMRRRLMAMCQRQGTSAGGVDDGIEIVDIRLRRLNYPAQVRETIYDRIISERQKKAAKILSDGRLAAEKLRVETDFEINALRTQVDSESITQRGEAKAKADGIRVMAYLRDPDYYGELEGQRIGLESFDSRTKIYGVDLWDFYFPRPNAMSFPQKKKPLPGGNEP